MVEATRGEMGRRSFLRVGLLGAGSVALWGRPGRAGATPSVSATAARFDRIDGTPLCYWRWNDATVGVRAQQMTFASNVALHDRLVRWVRDLRPIAEHYGGLRGMNRIVTGGVFVDKPGEHGKGNAFDLDQVRWANGAITPYHREADARDLRTRRRYLALDAVGRRHFHWVLDGHYNTDHQDHIHMDLGGGMISCDRTSRSDTVFVQQMINAHQASLPVTGYWGRATDAAFVESCRRLGVKGDPGTSTDVWRLWLLRAAGCAFADRPFSAPPPPIPDPLAGVVDQVVGQARSTFAEVQGVLGS